MSGTFEFASVSFVSKLGLLPKSGYLGGADMVRVAAVGSVKEQKGPT